MIESARRALIHHAAKAAEAAAREGSRVVLELHDATRANAPGEARQVAGCVDRYLERLRHSLAALEATDPQHCVQRWREFLAAYDDYLEVVRQVRAELGRGACGCDASVRPGPQAATTTVRHGTTPQRWRALS